MGVVLEAATPEDAAPIHQLHQRVLGESKWFVSEAHERREALADVSKRIGDFQVSPNSLWLVARLGRSVVGFVTLTGGALERQRHVARLEVMVDQRHRGHGIGKALMYAALEWARHNDMLAKVSLAVFDDNERAIALYRAAGFVEEGHRSGEYREANGSLRGDVLMSLDVGS